MSANDHNLHANPQHRQYANQYFKGKQSQSIVFPLLCQVWTLAFVDGIAAAELERAFEVRALYWLFALPVSSLPLDRCGKPMVYPQWLATTIAPGSLG